VPTHSGRHSLDTLIRLFAAARSLLYATGFVLLWAWVVASAMPHDARIAVELPAWLEIPGLVLAALGAAITLSCVLTFALIGKGTPAPFDPPREFVAVGPYRWVRNPMYLGAAAVICGSGLYLRSPAALAVAVFFILVTHAFVVLYEEPSLEHRFGESYLRYKSVVARWLPRRRIAAP
jgi:protein-S-isoprenylcysteine O-methyltransferase Ste14